LCEEKENYSGKGVRKEGSNNTGGGGDSGSLRKGRIEATKRKRKRNHFAKQVINDQCGKQVGRKTNNKKTKTAEQCDSRADGENQSV
jgi:hypothetical protein